MSLAARRCVRCGTEIAEGRKHTEEDCRKRLMVRLYDAQVEIVWLRRQMWELERRNDTG